MSKMKAKSLVMQISLVLLAQVMLSTAQAQSPMTTTTNVRRNVATIIFCGLGGAVLGISTLSFYGQPQNHVGDITTGFALGLLAGTAYVTMQATESTREQQQGSEKPLSLDPITDLAIRNHNPRPSLAWSWDF